MKREGGKERDCVCVCVCVTERDTCTCRKNSKGSLMDKIIYSSPASNESVSQEHDQQSLQQVGQDRRQFDHN